jgi:hypothetical protein
MNQATLSVAHVLKTPFPSYHKPLELARNLNRSGEDSQRITALRLLDGLRKRYSHVLAVGQEFVLALIESAEHDRAELALKSLEHTFANLDEETLCRWGRLFKDRGDDYLELPGAVSNQYAPNQDIALEFYRKSLEQYDRAYQIRFGYYPGINKATLLLMLGSLKARQTGQAPGSIKELFESEELARELLTTRTSWKADHPDDGTIWHSATAGEAQLLLQEWTQSTALYREALSAKTLNHHARETMLRQVERVLAAYRLLGVAIPAPFDDTTAFFAAGAESFEGKNGGNAGAF